MSKNTYEIQGQIIHIGETQVLGAKGFKKREFVISDGAEKYPQQIKLECTGDKVSLLDGLSTGSNVNVSFNLRGNEYNGKYYVNLQAWKISGDSQQTQPPQPTQGDNEEESDVPF